MSSLTLSAFPLVMTTYAVRVLLGALLLVVAMSASNTGPVYAATGDITTVAGTLIIGDGDGATNAFLKLPAGLATDGSGSVFIADTEQDRVRRVDAVTGIITTVAGTGERGFSGDGQAATGAQLAEPRGLAVDASNNLFIADASNGRIRKMDGVTKAISTIAGTGSIFDPFNEGALATSVGLQCVSDVAVYSTGDLLIADRCRHAIFKVDISAQTISTVAGTVNNHGFSGDGQAATAAKLKSPYGVAVDSDDNVYIADTGNDRIRKVDHVAKTIDTVAGSTPGLSGDNATPTAAQLTGPRGVAVDAFDNILIADTGNNRVRKVDFTAGLITTVAGTTFGFSGDSGPGTSAKLKSVDAVAVNPAGDVFATDLFSDRVRRVDAATQIIDTFAGGKVPLSGDNGPAIDAEINHPLGVALDKSGNLFIADDGNDRIRKVSANPGTITIFAGGGSTSGDGIPATDAMLSSAHDVAVHFDTGNVFIAWDRTKSVRLMSQQG